MNVKKFYSRRKKKPQFLTRINNERQQHGNIIPNERRFSHYSSGVYWKLERSKREREYIGNGGEGKKQGVLINFHSRVADNTNEASNEKCK